MRATLSAKLLLIAAAAGIAASMQAIVDGSMVAAPLAAMAAVAVLASVAFRPRVSPPTPQEFIDRVVSHADEGRRLVIYERETGLFAHWYVVLRGEEECDRARRYQRPLSILLLEPTKGQDAYDESERLAGWLRKNMRSVDIAGYLGNSRHILLMPETNGVSTEGVFARLSAEGFYLDAGAAEFGTDGTTYDELYGTAAARLDGSAPAKRSVAA
jgi:hypothetical protein